MICRLFIMATNINNHESIQYDVSGFNKMSYFAKKFTPLAFHINKKHDEK